MLFPRNDLAAHTSLLIMYAHKGTTGSSVKEDYRVFSYWSVNIRHVIIDDTRHAIIDDIRHVINIDYVTLKPQMPKICTLKRDSLSHLIPH